MLFIFSMNRGYETFVVMPSKERTMDHITTINHESYYNLPNIYCKPVQFSMQSSSKGQIGIDFLCRLWWITLRPPTPTVVFSYPWTSDAKHYRDLLKVSLIFPRVNPPFEEFSPFCKPLTPNPGWILLVITCLFQAFNIYVNHSQIDDINQSTIVTSIIIHHDCKCDPLEIYGNHRHIST